MKEKTTLPQKPLLGKIKKRLTQQQEFEILKLVLDKILWLGFGIMAFGLYQAFTASIESALWWLISGGVILIIFVWIIVREYEFMSK
ncbi:MAG TPA: hypothetical protein VI894_02080 [Candidatus Nanoarchaeia archaeon]|nr:hypothetical protein [Candidatus Nanoarchaeia archaeon]